MPNQSSSFLFHALRLKRLAPGWAVYAVDWLFSLGGRFSPKFPYNNISNDGSDPFFIVGCGRSGNTLLRTQLMGKYNVCIPPEIPGLGNTIRGFSRARGQEWSLVVDKTLDVFKANADVDVFFPVNGKKYNLNDELSLDYEEIKRRLLSLSENKMSLSSIVIELYQSYLVNQNMPGARIGDKTPWNVFHLDRLYKVFPGAMYVNLVRDPRAVVASYLVNFNGLKDFSVRDAAYRWKDSVSLVERFKERSGVNCIDLRYEDLVKNPVPQIERVASFLGLELLKNKRTALSFGDESLPHYKKAFMPIDTDSIEKWKGILTDSDVRIVDAICGKQMLNLGYKMGKEGLDGI